jgi:hypothetical protein
MENSDSSPEAGSVDRAAHRRKLLEKIRTSSTDPKLRQMADDVVTGKTRLEDGLKRPDITQTLSQRVSQFAERYNELTEDEKRQAATEGAEDIRNEAESHSPNTPRLTPRRPRIAEDDFEEDLSQRSSWLSGG